MPLPWSELHSTKILVCWSVLQKLSKWHCSVMSRLQNELESLLNLWERAGFKNGQHLSGAPVLALHRVLNIIGQEGRGNSSKGCVGGEKGLSHAHISSFIFNFQYDFRMIYTLTLTLWVEEENKGMGGMLGLCSGKEANLHIYDLHWINNHTKYVTSILHNIPISVHIYTGCPEDFLNARGTTGVHKS